MKELGYSPNLVFFNYLYFDDNNFLSHLENLPENNSQIAILESIKNAVQKGVKIYHRIFTIKDIEHLLLDKKPVIAFVSVADFRRVRLKRWRGHFVVLTGFDDRYFYYNDPHWDDRNFGEHKLEKEIVMAAIYRTRFPGILWIEKESLPK